MTESLFYDRVSFIIEKKNEYQKDMNIQQYFDVTLHWEKQIGQTFILFEDSSKER